MPVVRIPAERITNWGTFHDVFNEIFGFPTCYGRNMAAWIDCLTYVDEPDAGMTQVSVGAGDVLTLQLDAVDLIPGISLHAFGPGVITGTHLIGNVMANNGPGVSGQTTGIELFAIPGVGTIAGTQVLHDQISGDFFGVFHVGDTGTHVAQLTTAAVTVPVGP